MRPAPKAFLTLVMIVKDEARAIAETIRSVAGVCDHICILDTGSTDGTQGIVLETAAALGVPVVMHEEPFVDYSTTRNRALELARDSEWCLMLSGDEVLLEAQGLREWLRARTETTDDEAFDVRYLFGSNLDGKSHRITRGGGPWLYVGRTHEVLVHPEGRVPGEVAPAIVHYDHPPIDKTARWQRDVELLRLDAIEQPDNPRSIFYLAQTYACLGQYEAAHWTYREAARMGGFREHLYEAWFRAAECAHVAGWPWELVRDYYGEAALLAPERAEPLFRLAQQYWLVQDHDRAFPYALAAVAKPYPSGARLFVDRSVYDWRAPLLLASIYIPRRQYREARFVLEPLLDPRMIIPRPERVRAEQYLEVCRARLAA